MEEKPPPAPEASESPLPTDRAFVVQFRAQALAGADLFVGRIEHIASGAAQRFGSVEGLIAFVERMLGPAASSPGEGSSGTANEGKKT